MHPKLNLQKMFNTWKHLTYKNIQRMKSVQNHSTLRKSFKGFEQ